MPRKLNYPIKRLIALTEYADSTLIKIAVHKETTPAEQARTYVEDGIRRDRKLVERKAK